MSEATRIIAFLDASVLYPALLRNFMMHLALRDLFQPRWSDHVHEEWISALLRNRPDLTRAQLARTRRLMDEHVDDALVSGYEHLIDRLTLPDPKDRHVLAAAIHGGASVIVTMNLRDFPADALATYEIEAQHPDAFISALLDEYQEDTVTALREMQADLKNPPVSLSELLASLARQGLAQTVIELRRGNHARPMNT
jgi:predicted nucleic acid-binding protein